MNRDRHARKNITGPMLRKLRKRNGWTQKELSQKLIEAGWKKCTRGWLSRVESGEVILRDKDIPYLYAVLGREFETEFNTFMTQKADSLTPEKDSLQHAVQLASYVPACLLILI